MTKIKCEIDNFHEKILNMLQAYKDCTLMPHDINILISGSYVIKNHDTDLSEWGLHHEESVQALVNPSLGLEIISSSPPRYVDYLIDVHDAITPILYWTPYLESKLSSVSLVKNFRKIINQIP